MFSLLAALLVAPAGAPHPETEPAPSMRPLAAEATIRITLNGGDFAPGGRVRVQVEPSQDGYMVVFRVDGDGRIRVLFPIDPDLDPFVRGGKRYELRGRGGRETFLADDRGGSGLIYAALSREPLAFGQYAVNEHWDYEALRLRDQDSDGEAELSAIVRRMTESGRFDYDVTGYRVYDTPTITSGAAHRGYNDPFYDPYWSCLSCGWGYGRGLNVNFGFGSRWGSSYGWNDPWYRDPWNYDPYAYNSYYGYYGYPRAGSGWQYPGQYRPITVVNLPRPQVPITPYGFRARERQPLPLAGAFSPDLTRSMRPESRPSSGSGIDRGNNDSRGRSRNDGVSRGRPASDNGRRESSPPSSNAPASGRTMPSSPPPSSGSSGGSDNRARRRPELSSDVTPRSFEVPVDRRQAEAPRPIFREPRREPMVERSRPEPQQDRPVYREPPRVERWSPPAQQPAPRYEPPSSPPQSAPASAPAQSSDRARRRPA